MKVFAKAFLCGSGLEPEDMKVRLAAENPGKLVQAARATGVENEWFFEMLAAQTLQAESSGSLLAKKPEIDFLLRLAGTTQIAGAIGGKGARSGEPFVLVAAGTAPVRGIRALRGLELGRRELSKAELALIERAALLSAERA